MEAISTYTPRDSNEAEIIVERVSPRLNHANSAVILSGIKLMMHCLPFITTDAIKQGLPKKLSPSLGWFFYFILNYDLFWFWIYSSCCEPSLALPVSHHAEVRKARNSVCCPQEHPLADAEDPQPLRS